MSFQAQRGRLRRHEFRRPSTVRRPEVILETGSPRKTPAPISNSESSLSTYPSTERLSSPARSPSISVKSLKEEEDRKVTEVDSDEKTLEPLLLCSPPPTDSEPERAPTFEDVQTIIGAAGWWQMRVFLLAAFSGFCTALHNLVYGFIGAVPDHWCRLPNGTNYTMDKLKELLIPKLNGEMSQCLIYNYDWNEISQVLTVNHNVTEECKAMEYDNSDMRSTIPMQFDLVCKDAAWASAIQIAYMTGILVGSPIVGAISDWKGRKTAILIASLIFIITGPLIAFAPNFQALIVLRFILALGSPGVYATSYVLAIETMSQKWRGSAGNYFNVPFATGYMVLPGIAYLITDWKTLQIVLSLPALVLIATWSFLPESPRWLIRKGKLSEAEKILREAARVNNMVQNIPTDFSELLKKIYDSDRTHATKNSGKCAEAIETYVSIIESPRMRIRFLTLCLCWAIIGMTYYGLALNSSNLLTSRYFYTFIGGVLEFPAYLMVPHLIKRFGRKPVFITLVGTCGMALLSSLAFSRGSQAITGLSYLGKFVIGASYSLVYLYSSEMVPTLIRTYGLGLCSMMARLGSTVAPLIVDVVGRDNHKYPSLIFGCLALLVSTVALVLPETKRKNLPETIADVENEESDEGCGIFCCSNR